MDLNHYARIVRACFPDVTADPFRFLGGGSCRVFLADESLVFRFPHGPGMDEALRRERVFYAAVAPRLSVPIPRYRYFSEGCPEFPHPIAGYPLLAGVSLQDTTLADVPAVARPIGRFLAALHRLPPLGCAGPHARAEAAAMRAFYERIRAVAFPHLAGAERAWAASLFEPFLADPANWQFAPVLVHGDFDGSNILCDPATGALTGVIDFEDAGGGDPASDFCVLLAEYGSDFVDAMLAAYDLPRDPRFRERVTWRSRAVLFHELLYGLEHGEPDFAAHGHERLERAIAGAPVIGGWLARSTSEARPET